jgi:hypothetical protein
MLTLDARCRRIVPLENSAFSHCFAQVSAFDPAQWAESELNQGEIMKLPNIRRLQRTSGRVLGLILIALAILSLSTPLQAQDSLGGHVGFVLPLVTHAGGETTTLGDNFSIGFPMGITVKGKSRTAFDMEFVPSVQDRPRTVSLWCIQAYCGASDTATRLECEAPLTLTARNSVSLRF